MPAPPRRLNLVDGMIVLAGVAGCLLLTRLYADEYWPAVLERFSESEGWLNSTTDDRVRVLLWTGFPLVEGVRVGSLWLAVGSPLVLLLRLRLPRPRRHRLLAQPGTIATLAATLALGLGMALWVLTSAVLGEWPGLFCYRMSFIRFQVTVGPAILLAWVGLALAGRWASERSAVDRVGRLLGVGWIVAFLLLAGVDFAASRLGDAVQSNDRYAINAIRVALDH